MLSRGQNMWKLTIVCFILSANCGKVKAFVTYPVNGMSFMGEYEKEGSS